MKLLLDTHIFLWALLDPGRLIKPVAAALEDPANELWLSPISTWECIVLAEKGRIVLEPEPIGWIRDVLNTFYFKEATLNHEVAILSRVVTIAHQDPADRFLLATAMVYDLTLVTADERLLASKDVSILPNK